MIRVTACFVVLMGLNGLVRSEVRPIPSERGVALPSPFIQQTEADKRARSLLRAMIMLDPASQEDKAHQLVAMADDAVPYLRREMLHGTMAPWEAAYVLGMLGTDAAIEALKEGAIDAEVFIVRVRCIKALGEIGSNSAKPLLVRLVRGKFSAEGSVAADSLKRIDEVLASEVILVKLRMPDANWSPGAVNARSKLLKTFMQCKDKPEGPARDLFIALRATAQSELKKPGSAQGVLPRFLQELDEAIRILEKEVSLVEPFECVVFEQGQTAVARKRQFMRVTCLGICQPLFALLRHEPILLALRRRTSFTDALIVSYS
ncbi:MAG: HEAT repeat domain-containing protein [Fimbriimonadales bacterium]